MPIPTLGRRGGGWVILQAVLLIVLAVLGVLLVGSAPWPAGVWALRAVGSVLVVGGLAVALWASSALGRSLTPLPAPRGEGVVRTGPFAIVRHPIYAGLLLFSVGFSLATTPWALLAVAGLFIVWALKCRVEEDLLREFYPDYHDYCRRVRWRIIPRVY